MSGDRKGYGSAKVAPEWPRLAMAFRLAEIDAIHGNGQYVRSYVDEAMAESYARSADNIIKAVIDTEKHK